MRYDTNGKGLEAGNYVVQVSSEPEEVTTPSGFAMVAMEFSIEGAQYPIKQRFFPNQLKGMFVALGFPEIEPGVFDGDIQKAFGRFFQAELYIEEYDKADGTKGRARKLRNFVAAPVKDGGPEGIVWNE